MNQLAKNLACEWAKDKIRINSVAPWYIKTSLVEEVRPVLYKLSSEISSVYFSCSEVICFGHDVSMSELIVPSTVLIPDS